MVDYHKKDNDNMNRIVTVTVNIAKSIPPPSQISTQKN